MSSVTIKKKVSYLGDRVPRRIVVFFLPMIVLLLLFTLIPSVLGVYFSFTNITLSGRNATNYSFIGFENYLRMMQDPRLFGAIKNTVVFTLFSAVLGQQILGFSLAFMLRDKSKNLRRFVGVALLAGWVTPEMVAALNLLAFYAPNGTLNLLIQGSLGQFLEIPVIRWLFDYPMVSVVAANIWRGTAFSMMFYDAALADVSKEVEEAALVDGASGWKRLTKIILPMLKNTIATLTVMVTLSTLGLFGLIFALTGGGPGQATTTLGIFMYEQAFVSFQIGYGAAISLVVLIFGMGLSVLYIRAMRSDI